MTLSPVLDFAAKVNGNGHRCQGSLIREWDCDVVAMLIASQGCAKAPCVAGVHWAIDLDPLRRRYAWAIQRDDASYSLVLRAGWEPRETPEQRIRREAVMGVLSQVMSASMGAPE